MIKIDYDKCCFKDGRYSDGVSVQNRKCCVEACPTRALSREKVIKVDPNKCVDCGACLKVCKFNAISMI